MIPRHFYIAVTILLLAVFGMGLYAWHMRGRAASGSIASLDTRPVVPPVAGFAPFRRSRFFFFLPLAPPGGGNAGGVAVTPVAGGVPLVVTGGGTVTVTPVLPRFFSCEAA